MIKLISEGADMTKELEAGLRAVRDMPDAPDAAGDDARVEAIAAVIKAMRQSMWNERVIAKHVILEDPATSHIRALEAEIAYWAKSCADWCDDAQAKQTKIIALEEKNRALVEAARRFITAGDAYMNGDDYITSDIDLMTEFGEAQEQLRLLVNP